MSDASSLPEPVLLEDLAAELLEVHRWRERLIAEVLPRMEAEARKSLEIRNPKGVLLGRIGYTKASTSRSIDADAVAEKFARFVKLLHEVGVEGVDAEIPREEPSTRRASLRFTLA